MKEIDQRDCENGATEFNPDFEPGPLTADTIGPAIDRLIKTSELYGHTVDDVILGVSFWQGVDGREEAKNLIAWAAAEIQAGRV